MPSTAGTSGAQRGRLQRLAGSAEWKARDQVLAACLDCHRQYKLEVPKLWADKEDTHAPARRRGHR